MPKVRGRRLGLIALVSVLVAAVAVASFVLWRRQQSDQQVTPVPTATSVPPSTAPSDSPDPEASDAPWPSAPAAKICGDDSVLNGPDEPPADAVVVPAGDNEKVDLGQADTTYWFAPGVHTLGTGQYSQIVPGDDSTYIGGPGAIIDGQRKNHYAFTQQARNVTIRHLTIRNFVAPMNEGTVNHDSGENWTMEYNTVVKNGGAGIFAGTGNRVSYNCLKDNDQYGFQAYGAKGGVQHRARPQRDHRQQHRRLGEQDRGLWVHRWRQVLGRRATSRSPTTTCTTT